MRVPPGLELELAAHTAEPGREVTLRARLDAAATDADLAQPQGEVHFLVNGEPVGSAPLDADGTATLTLPGMPTGVHTLTANFSGGAIWGDCEAPPVSLFVGVEPPTAAPEGNQLFLPIMWRLTHLGPPEPRARAAPIFKESVMHRVTRVATFAAIEAAFLARVQAVVWCSASTIDRHGRPRTRIVHPIWEGAVGWISTRRRSPKVAQLAANPAIALAYIGEPFQPCYVECRAAISDDVATKQRIWTLCNAYPEPFGFDPARVWGAPTDPENAVLRLTPWRIELNTFTENPETIIWEQSLQ